MQKSFNVALDLKRTLPIEDITMIEGDTGNRLIISVVDDGHPVDLTGCFVIVAFQRKDCVMWQSSANPDVIISDNTVTVDVLTESISADETYCEIQIYSDVERTELVTTSRFVIYVNKGIINDSAVQATNDYPILSQLVEDVEQIRSEFLEALERLQQIIDNLGGSGGSIEMYYLSFSIRSNAWPDEPPYKISLTNSDKVRYNDYLIAGVSWLSDDVNENIAVNEGWNKISEINPIDGGLEFTCLLDKPTCDLSLVFMGFRTLNANGYCYLTGHPQLSSGGSGGILAKHAYTHALNGNDPVTPDSIGASNAPYFLTITISASGFNGSYTQRIIDLDEIKGTDYIIASPLLLGGSTSDLSNEIKSWNLINKIAVSQGALYIYCYDELPTHDITVQLIGTHANMERGHCVLAGHSGHSNGSNIGHGIPAGGTAGQTLVKRTSEDYDVDWLTPTGGGGGTPYAHASTHAAGGSDPVTPDSIGASNAPYFLTITISASGFNGSYTQRIIDLDEIKGTDYIIASPLLLGGSTSDLSNEIKSWNLINKIAVSQGALYIYCYDELPTHDITVQLIGTHANMERGHCVLAGHSGHSNGSNIGHGIPAGGTAGQTLVKRTSEDYDVDWLTPTGGGGGTPYAHASTHAAGGSDPITPASIRAAPTSHASNTTGYGAGNGTNYGHLKLSDSVNSTLGISGGTAAAPVAVKAAYDLAASRADADHNHDDRYALIGHTHSGSGTSVEYKTITVPLDGWDAGVPCTQTISVAGVATTDYISAKYTSNAINTNERVADHAAYCCVTDGTPTPGGVLLTCWHERPTRDIRMVLRVEHGGTTGYMVMTGQARPSGGVKTANGSVITADQTISVTGLGFRPSMVSFVGSSGKTTITSGHGVDTGSTTAAWYADASGPGNVGTFSPSDDGFVLTVQGADVKTLNVGWQAVGD